MIMSEKDITSGNYQPKSQDDLLRHFDELFTENNVMATADFKGKLTTYGNGIKNSDSGFYYDIQLRNELTSVTLHPNTEIVIDDDGEWTGRWDKTSEATDDDGYRIRPLCRSILSEDFQVALSNTWSEFGDDSIGSMYNSLKPFAPYLRFFGKKLFLAGTKEDNLDDKTSKSSFTKAMKKIRLGLLGISDEGSNLLNRSLIAQGARFSYYSGTGTGFGNLSMKFTIFSDWKPTEKSDMDSVYNRYSQENMTNDRKFVSVNDQLSELYPYVMGKYEKGILNENGTVKNSNLKVDLDRENVDIINEYTAWEYPPGGYTPDFRNVNNIQFGTLKLKFGAFYSIPSLICSNAQFNFSKQMVKYWDNGKNKISPLYCDVVLNLQPATKFSDDYLQKFVSGQSMSWETSSIQLALKEKLDKIMEDNSVENRANKLQSKYNNMKL